MILLRLIDAIILCQKHLSQNVTGDNCIEIALGKHVFQMQSYAM